jgi:ATP/maltotriose-dependent transcriptional regulator MalT
VFGRLNERAALAAALRRVSAGAPAASAVVGEPGIGKTTLTTWILDRADRLGWRALTARGSEFERDVPLGVLTEALDDVLGRLPPDRLDGLGVERAAELAAVFPGIADRRRGDRIGVQAGRHRFHFAVRALLDDLARDGPLVLAIDDAHWADEASIELLAHLLRRPLAAPVLVLLAYRPLQASPLLIGALANASREWRASTVNLGPLTAPEVDELLGPGFDRHARSALYRESGGNPFYALQLARAPATGRHDTAESTRTTRDGAGVPWAVRASIEQELLGLSPVATTFLRAGAVAGEPFEADLAAEIAQLPVSVAMTALDELTAIALVRGTATPGRFAFRHPIVRRAVYESAGNGWRRAAHARAAAALAARGQSPANIAPHVERSAMVGDRAAVELLSAAADRVGVRAPATAARWYRAALRLAGDSNAEQELCVPLLFALATALAAEGRLEESRTHLAQALAALGVDERPLRTRLVAEIASLDVFRGRPQQARHVLLDAFDATPPNALADRAALLLEIAFDHFRSGESASAVDRASDALEAARTLGNRALIGRVAAGRALARTRHGSQAEAESDRATAERIFDRLSDAEAVEHFDGLCYLVWSSDLLGRYPAVVRFAERGLALSLANGRASLINVLTMALGLTRLRTGDVIQACEHAGGLLESARLMGAGPHLVWASALHAWVALERDDPTTALADIERAAGLLHTVAPGLACWLLPPVTAEVCLATGDPGRARECLLADGPEYAVLPANRRAWRLRLLVESESALGNGPAARHWAEQAEHSAAGIGGAVEPQSHALLAMANCLLSEGRPRDAADLSVRAVRGFDESGLVLDATRARMAAARALSAAGDQRSASGLLAAARAIAVSAGATRLARLAAEDARVLEGRQIDAARTPESRAAVVGLSARERDIVALVAQARTNREIAAALHLSVRTVDTYVSRILTKLAVPSRTAIAALANSTARG